MNSIHNMGIFNLKDMSPWSYLTNVIRTNSLLLFLTIKKGAKYLLLSLLCFGLPCYLIGQSDEEAQYIDSLKQQLNWTQLSNTNRFSSLYRLSEKYILMQADSARKYAHEAVRVATKIAQAEYQGRAWQLLADVEASNGRLDSLDIAYQRSKNYLENCTTETCQSTYINLELTYGFSFNDRGQHQRAIQIIKPLLSSAYISDNQKCRADIHLATCYLELNDFDEAFQYVASAKEKARQINDKKLQFKALYVYAWAYWALGQLDKTLVLNQEMLALAREMNQQEKIKSSLFSSARLYNQLNQPEEAIAYYDELLLVSNADTKDSYYSDALIGLIELSATRDPTAADRYVQELEFILSKNHSYRIIHVRRNILSALARHYLLRGQASKSEKYAQQHLQFIRQHQPDTASLVVGALEELSHIQAQMGQYEKAWHTLDTLHRLNETIVQRNQQAATAKAAVEMNLAENELARQKAEQKILLEQQSSANRTRFFIFLLIVAGLILGVISWAYRRSQHDKRLISEKNQLIEQSLAEKEVLLREIHHRVKNNLQIISSLLDKQARKSSDEVVRKLVKEGQERIQSMALIHQNLYESEQLSGIDIKSYLQELGANIQKSQAMTADQVELTLNVEAEKLDIDTAIPVGLILNELLTNSYKYAFVQNGSGKITVDFKKENDQYFLQISDNGVGFTPEQAAAKTKSLGLNLVSGLVRQLEGTMEWLNIDTGTAVAIRF